MYNNIKKENTRIGNDDKIGLITRTLCLYFWITVCGIYFFPSSITNLFKPIFVYFILIEFVFLKKRLRFNVEQIIAFLASIYYLFIFISSGINTLNLKGFAPVFLNCIVFVLVTSVKFNQNELELLINTVYFSGFAFSFFVAISNPFITSKLSRLSINYFGTSLNANGIPYFIVPSAVIAINKLIREYNKITNRFINFIMLAIMLYTVFYTNTRGAALALLISTLLIMLKYTIEKFSEKRIINVFFSFIIFIIIFIVIYMLLPENIINRIFNFSTYNLNNRDKFWKTAILLSKDRLFFGHGFNYWTMVTGYSYGTHNLYIDLLVSSGIIGSFLMMLLVIIILIKSKNIFLLSLLTSPILNSLLESGMTYSFWNPIILCVIIYSNKILIKH